MAGDVEAPGGRKGRHRTGWPTLLSRLLFVAGLGACFGFYAGFSRFAHDVASAPPGRDDQLADAAVVLTGNSDARLRAGVDLLERGQVPRLLISGVYRQATAAEVRAVAGGGAALYACCVTLGRRAGSTVGNAREIADWVARSPTGSLILVTDTYHMPRALLEVRQAVPGIDVIAYGVRQPPYDAADPWQSPRAIRGLLLEYTKYLLARLRLLLGLPPSLMDDRRPA